MLQSATYRPEKPRWVLVRSTGVSQHRGLLLYRMNNLATVHRSNTNGWHHFLQNSQNASVSFTTHSMHTKCLPNVPVLRNETLKIHHKADGQNDSQHKSSTIKPTDPVIDHNFPRLLKIGLLASGLKTGRGQMTTKWSNFESNFNVALHKCL